MHAVLYIARATSCMQWRRKFAESGGAIFYWKNISMVKPMEHPQNEMRLQPHSPIISTAYACKYNLII